MIRRPKVWDLTFLGCQHVSYVLRADSHYTSRFRSVAERHRSVKFFSHVYLNGVVHIDWNVSTTSLFRSVAVVEREYLTWRNGSEPVCTCSIPIMWTVLRLIHYTSSVCLQRVPPVFVFRSGWKINRIGASMRGIIMTCQIGSIVTESGKKNCGGKTGEEFKNHASFNVFYCAFWSYCHSIIGPGVA